MPDNPVLSAAEAILTVEGLRVDEAMTWQDLKPGLSADRIQADLVLRVCGREVRFPRIHYGFCFESASTFSLKAVLQAVVALNVGAPNAWRETHGGVRTHLLQLSSEPGDRFEFFIFDDDHLYFGYHCNRGGMLALETRLSLGALIDTETRLTESLIQALDAMSGDLVDCEERSRYLGRWEHLKNASGGLAGSLTRLLPPCEDAFY